MKRLLGVLFTIALLLTAHLVAVERLGDRELLTPPPDAVAEAFTREVTTKRWDQAQEYLTERVPQSTLEDLQAQLGEAANVTCETTSRDDEHASVNVKVRDKTLVMTLGWREGEWKVALNDR